MAVGTLTMKTTYRSLVVATCLVAALAGCAVNPATGRRQLNFLGTQQEIALGVEAAPNFQQSYGGPIPSAQVNQYVTDLGHRLADVSERPDLPWEFHAVDSAVVNAFALPGGKVFISRALLEKMDSEAQLAGVLGHEVGHVAAQHIGQRMSQSMLIQGALSVGLSVATRSSNAAWLDILGKGTEFGASTYLLKFGRDHESEADALGLRYMSRLGYNPAAQLKVMEVLNEAAKGPRPPEFLSTHPYPETRIKRIHKLLAEEYADHGEPGRYTEGQDTYKAEVLDRLSLLPPAQHNPQTKGE